MPHHGFRSTRVLAHPTKSADCSQMRLHITKLAGPLSRKLLSSGLLYCQSANFPVRYVVSPAHCLWLLPLYLHVYVQP